MKTLTELSGSVIRVAAAAIAEAKRALPGDAAVEAPPETAAPSVEAPAPAAEAPREPATAATPVEAESDAAKEAIDAAVAKATGLSGDRLTMLHGAIAAVGGRAADVRLVRVFALDEQVTGAVKIGAYQYALDLFPATMRQVTTPDDRGRRGGGRHGGGGGRGGGDRGVKGSGAGGFSMDSLREDRKSERGGRGAPGGGRRSGGRGGGGGPGGPPGAGPKK